MILFCYFTSTYGVNNEIVTYYNELKHPVIDTTRIAEVKDVIINRDVAKFHLEKGNIYFFTPVSAFGSNYVTGALFLGEGTFSFTPPTTIERQQLARFYKKETFKQDFNVLLLRFADSTFIELEEQIAVHTSPIHKGIEGEIEYCERYIYEERNEDIIYNLLFSLNRNPKNGFFYAHISEVNKDPVFFIYNPFQREEIQFEKRFSQLNYIREPINQFHKNEDYEKTTDFDKGREYFAVPSHYQIDVVIKSNGDFSATSNITIDVNTDQLIMMNFGLAPKLKVDEVSDSKGSALSFIKGDKSDELIIFLDKPLNKGDRETISISYHGDVLERIHGDFFIKSNVLWYPRYAIMNRATYDLTFKTPKQYEFVSIGRKIEDKMEEKYKLTRWLQETPVLFASFNLGLFKTYNINIKGSPPITILMSEVGHRELALYLLEEYGIASGKNMEKQVGADIANSMQLFNNLFGPFPYERLYVTETPFPHGISFPGLLHLSWSTFQVTDEWGNSEMFRAHEVAHQWWGNAVGCNTYHDAWLSEGFAEYAGLWYLQWIIKDNKRFFQVLEEWKNDILSNRKYVLGSGAEAGPIWLGPRTSSSETRGDYLLIVYKKGAYVLHMLRNMLIDLKTMNEDRFENLLKDFFRTYKGKDASTEDFKKIVDKHCGENMDWFFNQWIYGTDIPTYKFSYYTSEKPDGKYLINCCVVQEDVPDDFKMYVPITIKFKGDQFARLRITIDKPKKEFSFPSPMKPEKIIFNEFNSVLAKVKYVKYE